MPIKIKFADIDFGSTWYVKNDPDQFPHTLVAIVILPGNQIRFRLSYFGDVSELWDFECSQEMNPDMIRKEL